MCIRDRGLNQADYTEESWNQLQAALKAAVELKGNVNATQSDIDAAAMALQEALDLSLIHIFHHP